jgi:hypothetical protein
MRFHRFAMPVIFNSEDHPQNESESFLSAGMLHDLNNLLTVINGHNEVVLASRELPEKLRQSAAAAHRAGLRAASLSHALMTVGRTIPIEPRYIHLSQCVAELVSLTRNLMPAGIELVSTAAPDLPGVMADPCAILQILLNLTMNARDAMPAGGKLEIETARAAPSETVPRHPGDYVVLTVRDNGAGMDQATGRRIFDPFYTTKPPRSGSGLGLPVVQHIVKRSGGFLTLESELGKGTAVHIYFPAARPESAPANLVNETSPCVSLGGKETILVVEDDADLRSVTRNLLEHRGYAVLAAATAAEAIELARNFNRPLDLLVTEVELPDSTGPALAATLRESQPDLPVLNISGYPLSAAGEQHLSAGADFLAKPFTVGELGGSVREILDRRPAKRILFVDDDEQVVAFARDVLESEGYDVLVAEDGNVALAIAEKEPLDLVITDLVMRDREGLDTMMQLRSSNPSLPVIAISGAFGGYFLRSASMLGARATLPKPFSGDDLLAVVRMVLEG